MVHKQLYTKVRNPSACVESSRSVRSTMHFRGGEKKPTVRLDERNTRENCRHLFTSRMVRIRPVHVTVTTRCERWFGSPDRERVENATDADESPRASASVFRLSCRGYYRALQFANFLASWSAIVALDWPTSIPTLVPRIRAHASSPIPQET